VAKPAKDASVFAQIEALVAEEHRLFEHGEPSDEQKKRLGEVQIELDRYWDLLRLSAYQVDFRRLSATRLAIPRRDPLKCVDQEIHHHTHLRAQMATGRINGQHFSIW